MSFPARVIPGTRDTNHQHRVHNVIRRRPPRRPAARPSRFSTAVYGRAERVSVGVGILAGAILTALGICLSNPPLIAFGALVLTFSLLTTTVAGIKPVIVT